MVTMNNYDSTTDDDIVQRSLIMSLFTDFMNSLRDALDIVTKNDTNFESSIK
jgi:hypothetical protein